ncbi:hypothetical protein [Methanobrevibacter sp.]|uniref:hypothetical protein n=1 Tax=Methanobrevibacter sp. TaxID=66852 RepID=UPI00388E47A3
MNRCINDEFKPIQYIALGNTSNIPQKEDIKLGNETSRRKCVCLADLVEKQIQLTASFKADEVIGTSEIGVFSEQILISHDKYSKIDESFLGVAGDVKIEYIFQFSTGGLRGGWKSATKNHVFYVYEPNNVVGVLEKNSNSWYSQVDSIDDLDGLKGAYYIDTNSKNLYIRPKRDMILEELEEEEIIVQVK